MDTKYPVPCPLLDGGEVDSDDCFFMHCVVDEDDPEHIVPRRMRENQNFREICKSCKYHEDQHLRDIADAIINALEPER